ncbi:MAG: amino acid transporter, partial [Mycobacteriaceae bacterium]
VEVVMLIALAVVALVRVYLGSAPPGSLRPSWGWFNPWEIASPSSFVEAILLMVFIYWGWDSSVSINEETRDSTRTPGRAAVLSTLLLVAIYVLLTVAAQAFAGVGTMGIGLANPANTSDVLSAVGTAVFGGGWIGTVLTHLLLLMVLTSAAASTQTTILPTARTTFAMAVYKALPDSFARVHPRYLTPTVSTVVMGAVSAALYVGFNFVSGGAVISDAVTAIGVSVGFYYGLTGFACTWLYRHTLLSSPRHFVVRGMLPSVGGVLLFFAVAWTVVTVWAPDAGFTSWTMPFTPHWQIGGVFLIGVGSMVLGLPLMVLMARVRPAFFRGEVLAKGMPGRVG